MQKKMEIFRRLSSLLTSPLSSLSSSSPSSFSFPETELKKLILCDPHKVEASVPTLNGLCVPGKVVDVHDGDSCKIVVMLPTNKLTLLNCRLQGIDAPEIKPPLKLLGRDKIIQMALQSRNRLIQLCTDCMLSSESSSSAGSLEPILFKNRKCVTVQCGEYDKYGRVLVKLTPFQETKTCNERLLEEHLVVPYDGGKKRRVRKFTEQKKFTEQRSTRRPRLK